MQRNPPLNTRHNRHHIRAAKSHKDGFEASIFNAMASCFQGQDQKHNFLTMRIVLEQGRKRHMHISPFAQTLTI